MVCTYYYSFIFEKKQPTFRHLVNATCIPLKLHPSCGSISKWQNIEIITSIVLIYVPNIRFISCIFTERIL